jgi:hypothetical protein
MTRSRLEGKEKGERSSVKNGLRVLSTPSDQNSFTEVRPAPF